MTREQEYQVDLLCRCWGGRTLTVLEEEDDRVLVHLPDGRTVRLTVDGMVKRTRRILTQES